MPSGQVFELAVLLSLKDALSGGLDRVDAKLRATGKTGQATLQTFESLRKSISRDLAIGGIGIGALSLLKKGVDNAAEYETSVLSLKSAYQEVAGASALSATEQGAQLNQLSKLAKRMGNDLQGNTQNYIDVLVGLKQAGVETTTVLNGAGEAASYLANVSGALLEGRAKEQAKELGQFGKMFKLKPEDFLPSVNLFSALKDRFDIDSSSLVESSKYFLPTANSLGMTGLGGAQDTAKFFALMKRQAALEGSQAGTSATSMFTMFVTHKKDLAKLKKELGIDLQLFDKKGNFQGWENAFKQMEQFRKLTGEKRAEALNRVFGEQGGKVAGAMVESGAEGWRNITTESAKAVSVNEKINQQMATYAAKMEALEGTITNLKAVTFTPMLDSLKPGIDLTNQIVSGLQGFAEAHPAIAKTGTTLFGLAAVNMTVYSGIRMMITGWRLWKIVSAVGAGEQGLLTFLRKTRTESLAAGDAMQTASVKAGGLKSRLSGLSGGVTVALRIGSIIGLEYAIQTAIQTYLDAREAEKGARRATSENVKALDNLVTNSTKANVPVDPKIYESQATSTFSILNLDDQLKKSLGASLQAGSKYNSFNEFFKGFLPANWNQYGAEGFQPHMAKQVFREKAPELSRTEVMLPFLKLLEEKIPNQAQRSEVHGVLAQEFPTAFKEASQQLVAQQAQLTAANDSVIAELLKLPKPTTEVTESFKKLHPSLVTLPSSFTLAGDAATNFANRINELNVTSPTPGAATPQPSGGPLIPSLFNKTGSVRNDRLQPAISPLPAMFTLPGDVAANIANRINELNITVPPSVSAPQPSSGTLELSSLLSLWSKPTLDTRSNNKQVPSLAGKGEVLVREAQRRDRFSDYPALRSLATESARDGESVAYRSGDTRINMPVSIEVNAPGASAEDSAQIAQAVSDKLKSELAEVKRQLGRPDFIAKSALYAARRDQERVG